MRWTRKQQEQEQPLVFRCPECDEVFSNLMAAYDHARTKEHPLAEAEVILEPSHED